MITCQDLEKEIEKVITTPDTNSLMFSNVGDTFKEHFRNINIYYAWLTASVKVWKPKKIVELGAETGASTLALYLKKQKDTKLISIDYNSQWPFVPPKMLNDKKNVKLIAANDLDESMIKKNKKLMTGIDYLFIDTNHTYEQISKEAELYTEFLASPALIVIDDIQLGGLDKFWKEIPYETMDISKYHSCGFGFFIFNR